YSAHRAPHSFPTRRSSDLNGPVAAPLMYTEQIPSGNSDIAMGAANFATRTKNKSLGFNAQWRATKDLRFEFDAHHSTAESMADRSEEHTSELQSRSDLVCR